MPKAKKMPASKKLPKSTDPRKALERLPACGYPQRPVSGFANPEDAHKHLANFKKGLTNSVHDLYKNYGKANEGVVHDYLREAIKRLHDELG
jgi:hypothetical protein